MPTKAVKITLQVTIAICSNLNGLNSLDNTLRKNCSGVLGVIQGRQRSKGKVNMTFRICLEDNVGFLMSSTNSVELELLIQYSFCIPMI